MNVLTGLGDERVAYVSRDDLAAAAAGVLLREGHVRAIYNGTGPAIVSGPEKAAIRALDRLPLVDGRRFGEVLNERHEILGSNRLRRELLKSRAECRIARGVHIRGQSNGGNLASAGAHAYFAY
jgi:hypothetical protein